MRLGKYPCTVKPGTKMAECYGEAEIWERHRHRYEFNNEFRQEMEDAGLVISGTSPDGRLVETVELPGRDFHLGAQFTRVQEPPQPRSSPVQGLYRRRTQIPHPCTARHDARLTFSGVSFQFSS